MLLSENVGLSQTKQVMQWCHLLLIEINCTWWGTSWSTDDNTGRSLCKILNFFLCLEDWSPHSLPLCDFMSCWETKPELQDILETPDNTLCLRIMLFHDGCGLTDTFKREVGHFFFALFPFEVAQVELLLRNIWLHVLKGISGGAVVTFIWSSYLNVVKSFHVRHDFDPGQMVWKTFVIVKSKCIRTQTRPKSAGCTFGLY